MLIKKTNYKKFFKPLSIFAAYFAISILNYNFYFTNKFTPGGDGTRIYHYLKYMEKVPETFPFWHAHKHHGYPLISDPENYDLTINTGRMRIDAAVETVVAAVKSL